MFDVTMRSFDGAEMCEIVGLYILDELSLLFGKDYVGLYRDDGLLLLKSNSGRIADLTRKKLHQTFDKFGLKITVEVSHQSVNFLENRIIIHSISVAAQTIHPQSSSTYPNQLTKESSNFLPTKTHLTRLHIFIKTP